MYTGIDGKFSCYLYRLNTIIPKSHRHFFVFGLWVIHKFMKLNRTCKAKRINSIWIQSTNSKSTTFKEGAKWANKKQTSNTNNINSHNDNMSSKEQQQQQNLNVIKALYECLAALHVYIYREMNIYIHLYRFENSFGLLIFGIALV